MSDYKLTNVELLKKDRIHTLQINTAHVMGFHVFLIRTQYFQFYTCEVVVQDKKFDLKKHNVMCLWGRKQQEVLY